MHDPWSSFIGGRPFELPVPQGARSRYWLTGFSCHVCLNLAVLTFAEVNETPRLSKELSRQLSLGCSASAFSGCLELPSWNPGSLEGREGLSQNLDGGPCLFTPSCSVSGLAALVRENEAMVGGSWEM